MGYSPLVQCPFDQSHIVLRSRFISHLIICGKNHQGVIVKECPYNTWHVLHVNMCEQHVIDCPAKQLLIWPLLSDSDPRKVPYFMIYLPPYRRRNMNYILPRDLRVPYKNSRTVKYSIEYANKEENAGKITIPDLKIPTITEEEFQLMRTKPGLSKDILKKLRRREDKDLNTSD